MKRVWNLFFVLVAAIFILACSSNGGRDSVKTATGKFIDGPVYGLSYVSGHQSGTTGMDGSFTYEVGSTIRFYIGNVTIGIGTAKSVMTPIDLAKNIDHQAGASHPYVLNVVRFLMSISKINKITGRMTMDASKVIGSASVSDFNVSTSAFTATLAGISSGNQYTEAQAKAHFFSYIPVYATAATAYEQILFQILFSNGSLFANALYYPYNGNGKVTKIEYDYNNDGKVDSFTYYTYNANGVSN